MATIGPEIFVNIEERRSQPRIHAAPRHMLASFVFLVLYVAWVASLAALAASPAVAQVSQPVEPTIRFVRNPDHAPEFKLASLDGKPVTLATAHGKVVLLNFWATWCGPCRAEIPALVALQDKYKDQLQVIGLNVDDDDPAVVKQFVEEHHVNYEVARASDDVRMQYGGIPALPTTFVLDREGRVVQKHVGLWSRWLFETEIRALLGLPINVRVETFEDTGEVFLKHADRATELPGVDMSKLTPEQKKIALRRFNAETCSCGCTYTLAQCRIVDSACAVSQAATAKIIAKLSGAAPPTGAPSAQHTSASSTPSAGATGGGQRPKEKP